MKSFTKPVAPGKGQNIKASDMANHARAIEELQRSIKPQQINKTRNVTSIKPLTLRRGSAVDKFQVVPGYINLEMPTLSGTDLDDATPPEITVTADVWVWLKCVGTFGDPDTYIGTIETTATSATPSGTTITATGFVSFRPIGKVDYTAGTPNTYVTTSFHSGGHLGVESFGNVNIWWIA